MSLRPHKRLGQNFLRDPNTARKIVASLTAGPDDYVVEIGPGTGALTHILADRFPRFSAIEVDQRAVDLLAAELPGVRIRHADVLEVDWTEVAKEAGGRLHVIGNLPYYITTPILFSLLDQAPLFDEAVVMMQREVARRLVARPNSKEYGILSVVLQREAPPELLFDVSRNVFYPKPDVTSAVVRLDFQKAPASDLPSGWLRTVVRAAFNQRRKTLRNSLGRLGLEVPERWSGLRADALSPEDFVELAAYLQPPEATT